MSKKGRFELNTSGVAKLLRSHELQNVLETKAAEIASRAGEGYAHDSKMMGTRVIASVYTETKEAALDCADNNTLLKVTY